MKPQINFKETKSLRIGLIQSRVKRFSYLKKFLQTIRPESITIQIGQILTNLSKQCEFEGLLLTLSIQLKPMAFVSRLKINGLLIICEPLLMTIITRMPYIKELDLRLSQINNRRLVQIVKGLPFLTVLDISKTFSGIPFSGVQLDKNYPNWLACQLVRKNISTSDASEEEIVGMFCGSMKQTKSQQLQRLKVKLREQSLQLSKIRCNQQYRIQSIKIQKSMISPNALCQLFFENRQSLIRISFQYNYSLLTINQFYLTPLKGIRRKEMDKADSRQFTANYTNLISQILLNAVSLSEIEINVKQPISSNQSQILANALKWNIQKQQINKFHLIGIRNHNIKKIVQNIATITLTDLNLDSTYELKDQSLILVASQCSQLRRLQISDCRDISNRSIQLIIHSCPFIQYLNISNNKQLNDSIFEQYLFQSKFLNIQRYNTLMRLTNAQKSSSRFKYIDVSGHKNHMQQKGLFSKIVPVPRSMRQLNYLNCQYCNNISSEVLKTIAAVTGASTVIDTEGSNVSLYSGKVKI